MGTDENIVYRLLLVQRYSPRCLHLIRETSNEKTDLQQSSVRCGSWGNGGLWIGGYVLFFADTPQLANLPNLTKVPFDPVKDFAAISIVSSNPFVLAVNNSFPALSLAQFIEYAKAHPGKLSYASAGSGSLMHLSMALLVNRAGLDMVHVSYKG